MPEEVAGAGPVKPYRILSLDGGGTWALIQAMALQKLFGDRATGWDVLRQFDLVVANSGGSIVAGGLVSDLPLADIVNLFNTLEIRKKIFAPILKLEFAEELLHEFPVPRYATTGKLHALGGIFRGAALEPMSAWRSKKDGSDLADVVIIAFDYDAEGAAFFRTDPKSLASFSGGAAAGAPDTTFLEAIHASSTPPVLFFNQPASRGGEEDRRYWDGAMAGYNNPIVAGLVEVLANGTAKRDDIRVLSVGTGVVPQPPGYRATGGLLQDATKAGLVMLDEPPETATFVAHVVLDGRIPQTKGDVVSDGRVVRLSPVATRDNPDYPALLKIQLDAIEDKDVAAIYRFAALWLKDEAPNQPIRPAAGTAPADIGQDSFSAAVKAFRSWATVK